MLKQMASMLDNLTKGHTYLLLAVMTGDTEPTLRVTISWVYHVSASYYTECIKPNAWMSDTDRPWQAASKQLVTS